MNLIEEAKALGFSDAAVISTDQLVFVPEYRVFCEDNLCGNYDKNPACPPQSGTVEEMKEHALKYEKTLILQTMQDGLMDYKKAKLAHNKLTEQLAEKMKEAGITDLLIMSAGPYKHNSCINNTPFSFILLEKGCVHNLFTHAFVVAFVKLHLFLPYSFTKSFILPTEKNLGKITDHSVAGPA